MQEIEFAILYWFQGLHHPLLDKIVVGLTTLGNSGILWIILTLLMLIFCKEKKGGVAAMISLILSVVIVNLILKNVVARPRPMWIADASTFAQLIPVPEDYSFPSGHSSAGISFAVAILPFYKKQGIAAIILASLIALTRLYLFVHWPTDVLFGVLIGIIDGIVATILVKWWSNRRAKTV